MKPPHSVAVAEMTIPVSSETRVSGQWTTIIRPRRSWFRVDFKELWAFRDLVLLFVRRDFVVQYKQTVLGPLWAIIQPLFTTLIFTVVFGRIAKIPTDGIPDFLFFLSGTVCWSFFSTCLTQTSNTFVSNAAILGKVYFPRLVIPISTVISASVQFAIQFFMFLAFLVHASVQGSPVAPNLWALALPLLAIQIAVLGLGCGIFISAMTSKYRDLALAVPFSVQLWMFVTPVVYPLSQIPERFRTVYCLNPMVSVVESFRQMLLGTSSISTQTIVLSLLVTVAILFFGLALFTRMEKTFMDTV
jgi:lipopolysaccharide transport system permease protein